MRSRLTLSHALVFAAAGVLAAVITATGTDARASAASPTAQSSAAQAASTSASGYVGSDSCQGCHEQGERLKGTAHAQVNNPRSPAAAHGCESCHGPGQAHVDDDDKGHIVKFAQMKPAAISETCLTCHNRGEHAGWEGSAHELRNLSCTTCHSVHSAKSETHQLVAATQTALCATCHRLQVAKTERAVAHMPVREGKMSCSSCHNPHGSISNVKNLKTGSSVAELCTSCHTEMRGPVL